MEPRAAVHHGMQHGLTGHRGESGKLSRRPCVWTFADLEACLEKLAPPPKPTRKLIRCLGREVSGEEPVLEECQVLRRVRDGVGLQQTDLAERHQL